MKLDPGEARAVLRQSDFGALATQSATLEGFPFVSHVALALDGAGDALLLLSRLAEHSRNLAADPRASLMATVPGPDPQAQRRLTLVGELAPCAPGPALVRRYLRYHPEAEAFLGFGDFHFHRLRPLRIRLVGGFARAGWIEAAGWALPPLDEGEEEAVLAALEEALPAGWSALGLGWEGIDLRDATGGRRRLAWAPRATTLAGLGQAARDALRAIPG
jgi:putative heme iron utilization protein